MSFYKFLFLGLTTIISGCAKQHDSVARTAAANGNPTWTCSEGSTQVEELGDGKYRLIGCGENVVYQCNFSAQPPRCWR
jgi:hypothetical protein